MSQRKNPKKVIVTKKKGSERASSRRISKTEASKSDPMLFGKSNYIYMLAGIGLIILGMILMSGGHMPNAQTWDDSIIYSFRRVTLAPIIIILGLLVEIYAIFK